MIPDNQRQTPAHRIASAASATGIALLLAASVARADAVRGGADTGADAFIPRIEGSLLFELQNDHTVRSDAQGNEINDLFPTVELATGLVLSRNFSLQSLLILEPVLPTTPFQDRAFDALGAFAEELYVQYEHGNIRIFAGKFDASFGTAWDKAPGIYGTELAEDYELAERIGGGIGVMFTSPLAEENTLTINGFFTDNSILSESAFTNRGRTNSATGGAGNTGGPQSFSVTLDSGEFGASTGLTTHLGLVHQAAGTGDTGDENGFVAGVNGVIEIAPGKTFTALLEGAHFNRFGGGGGDNTYVTVGGQYIFGPWNLAATAALRRVSQANAAPIEDYFVQFGGGYEVQDGFLAGTAIDAAIALTRDAGIRTTLLGLKISREFEFTHVLR